MRSQSDHPAALVLLALASLALGGLVGYSVFALLSKTLAGALYAPAKVPHPLIGGYDPLVLSFLQAPAAGALTVAYLVLRTKIREPWLTVGFCLGGGMVFMIGVEVAVGLWPMMSWKLIVSYYGLATAFSIPVVLWTIWDLIFPRNHGPARESGAEFLGGSP